MLLSLDIKTKLPREQDLILNMKMLIPGKKQALIYGDQHSWYLSEVCLFSLNMGSSRIYVTRTKITT